MTDPVSQIEGSRHGAMAPPLARTLPDLLREQALIRPDSIAAIVPGAEVTFSQLFERSCHVASGVRQSGIRRGDRVGILLGNGVEWLETMFGAAMAGATVVPFSTWSTRSELDFLVQDSHTRLLFCASKFGDRDFAADIADLMDRKVGRLEECVLFGGGEQAAS